MPSPCNPFVVVSIPPISTPHGLLMNGGRWLEPLAYPQSYHLPREPSPLLKTPAEAVAERKVY